MTQSIAMMMVLTVFMATLLILFIFGLLFFWMAGNTDEATKITSVNTEPVCNATLGEYTPGTCGVYTTMQFIQCITENTTKERGNNDATR